MVFRARRWLAPALLCLLASACASPEPNFYNLQPVPGTVHTGRPLIVEVRRPGLAGYLDRSDIVLGNAGYRLSVNSQDRWAEPLGDMIGRVVTQDLAQRLPASSVFTESGAITADPTRRVEIDVQRFDTNEAGTLTLAASFAIEQGTGHTPVATRMVTLHEPLAQRNAGALAAAMSTLLGRLADEISQEISKKELLF